MLALLLAVLLQQDPASGPAAPPPPPPAAKPAPAVPKAPRALPAPPTPGRDAAGADRRATAPLRGEWPAQPSGKRITLDKSVAVDDALQEIADAAGWNAVLNTGRTGSRQLVLRLRNVPVEDALRAALAGAGLVATRTGDTVVVTPSFELDAPREAPEPALSGFDAPTGKRFTGDFDDEDVSVALRAIAKGAGLSIVLPRGTHGSITAHFEDVPVEDALRAVLAQGRLTGAREGSLLVVREGAGGFSGSIPPGLGRETRRMVEEKMRDAERRVRDAEREVERDARDREGTGDMTIGAGDTVRDVNVVKGDLLVRAGAEARDIAVVAGSVRLEPGATAREVAAVLGGVTLDGGATAREVVAVGGDVVIGPGAVVEQDVVSVGGRVRIDPSAEVGSSRSISIPSLPGLVGFGATGLLADHAPSPAWTVLQVLVKFGVLFVLGLLVLALFPRRLDAVAGSIVASPWKSVLAGLLGSIAMPLLTLLLVVTVIGIPLVAVQVLAMIAAGVVGVTALTFHLGRSLPLRIPRSTQVIQLAIGTAILAVLTALPVIGVLAWIAIWLLAFGAVLRSRFGQPPAALPTTMVPPAAGP
jgi:hypothetical protein